MGCLKAGRRESEPSNGESIEEGDKDGEGELAGIISQAHQSFEEALYGWATILEDFEKSLPIAGDKCQFHVVSVRHHRPARF